VGGIKICNFCDGTIVKHGIMKSRKQRYKCKDCYKTQVDYYTYQAYQPQINKSIVQLNNEGVGIRSISRILKISTTTLLRRIIAIANNIPSPTIIKGKSVLS
jgi:insertion element IS1 protein InsB